MNALHFNFLGVCVCVLIAHVYMCICRYAHLDMYTGSEEDIKSLTLSLFTLFPPETGRVFHWDHSWTVISLVILLS